MDVKTMPLVTIGIPTYNCNAQIIKPLLSIWQQQYPNLEILISDNCSTDNTQEVIETICKDHPEIRYIRQEKNIGMIPNFEYLLRAATGKYFMWVSDDDRLEPDVLLKCVDFMESNSNYSLVSGVIKYWKNDKPDIEEGGFTFEQNSASIRTILFYHKVIYCGLVHGLMRRELTSDLSLRKVIGNDYHFVANLVYLGKVKHFDFVGYNKTFGGASSSFRKYAKVMGESWLAGIFPHFKMAGDAFEEVMHRSPAYSTIPTISRFGLAISSFFGILYCYYIRIFIGARINNWIISPISNLLKKSAAGII